MVVVVVVVFITLTDRTPTIFTNGKNTARGCQSGSWSAGQGNELRKIKNNNNNNGDHEEEETPRRRRGRAGRRAKRREAESEREKAQRQELTTAAHNVRTMAVD